MSRSVLVIALSALIFHPTIQAAESKQRTLNDVLRTISAQQVYRKTDEIAEVVNAVAAERSRGQHGQKSTATAKSTTPPSADAGKFAKVVVPNTASNPKATGTELKSAMSPEEAEIREVIMIMNPGQQKSAGGEIIRGNTETAHQRVIDLDGESVAPLIVKTTKNKPRAPSAAPAPARAKSPLGLYTYGPIRNRMTLAEVAANVLPSDQVTVAQMMWALYRKNTKAFVNQDIGNLKPNSTLNVPDLDEVTAIGRMEAEVEIERLRAINNRTASAKVNAAL